MILSGTCRTRPIYRSLFVQSRGVLKRELFAHLRRQHRFRHARAAPRVGHHPGRIVDVVSILDRPAEVADRAIPGHWEGDLLVGAGYASQVATLPKGTDLSPYSQAQLDAIAHRLNTRPRLTLAYQTPADKLAEIVASTG